MALFRLIYLSIIHFDARRSIGYEIIGLENIPEHGPGLLVYYHGALPIDFYYVYAKTHLYRNRRFKIIADKFLFRIPGILAVVTFDYQVFEFSENN